MHRARHAPSGVVDDDFYLRGFARHQIVQLAHFARRFMQRIEPSDGFCQPPHLVADPFLDDAKEHPH